MDFEASIPDYINHHLSESELALFEAQLLKDPSLQAQVELERRLRHQMREPNLPQTRPNFDTFSKALNPRPWWTHNFAWSAAMAIAFVAVLGLAYFPIQSDNAEFRTLSSGQAIQAPVIRIVLHDFSELDKLAATYDLEVISLYPTAQAVDVTPDNLSDEERARLMQDHRIRLLQFLEPGTF